MGIGFSLPRDIASFVEWQAAFPEEGDDSHALATALESLADRSETAREALQRLAPRAGRAQEEAPEAPEGEPSA